MPRPDPLILLSFDTEEFDIPLEYGAAIGLDEQLRVNAEGHRRVLALLDRVSTTSPVRATFFTTAVFAQAFPDLIRETAQRGHEIASHGFAHSTFENEDLARSKVALEAILGAPGAVIGFRRARMAHTDPHAIAAAGYRYNSSENPIWLPGRYNHLRDPRRAYWVSASPSLLLNIPAAATPIVRWPLFWLAFKNMPLTVTKAATRWCLAADRYAAMYFHPWEFSDLGSAGGYGLPKMVRRIDGAALLHRLERFIKWGSRRAAFATYAQFAATQRPPAFAGGKPIDL